MTTNVFSYLLTDMPMMWKIIIHRQSMLIKFFLFYSSFICFDFLKHTLFNILNLYRIYLVIILNTASLLKFPGSTTGKRWCQC